MGVTLSSSAFASTARKVNDHGLSGGHLNKYLISHNWSTRDGNEKTFRINWEDSKEHRLLIKRLRSVFDLKLYRAIQNHACKQCDIKIVLTYKDDPISPTLYALSIYAISKGVNLEIFKQSTLIPWDFTFN